MQWRGRWGFAVREEAWHTWAAWLTSLRGGLRTFKGRPRRRWPRAYPKGFAGLIRAAGGAFTGAATVATIGATRDAATISGLPNAFVLKAGDHFSVTAGTRQHLHRITEGGTSAAGAVALLFEPPLRPGIAVGAAVTFDGPWCDMVLVADHSESSTRGGGTVAFEGIQVLT